MRLTIILLLFCSLTQAQPGFIERIPEPVKVIGLFTFSIVLEGIGDGLYDEGKKEVGKLLQAVSLGSLLMSPLFLDMDKSNWGWYLASYVSLRIGFFDYSYNLSRGLPMGYIGDTSYWDKGMRQVAPPGPKIFFHSIFITVGFVIPIKEL